MNRDILIEKVASLLKMATSHERWAKALFSRDTEGYAKRRGIDYFENSEGLIKGKNSSATAHVLSTVRPEGVTAHFPFGTPTVVSGHGSKSLQEMFHGDKSLSSGEKELLGKLVDAHELDEAKDMLRASNRHPLGSGSMLLRSGVGNSHASHHTPTVLKKELRRLKMIEKLSPEFAKDWYKFRHEQDLPVLENKLYYSDTVPLIKNTKALKGWKEVSDKIKSTWQRVREEAPKVSDTKVLDDIAATIKPKLDTRNAYKHIPKIKGVMQFAKETFTDPGAFTRRGLKAVAGLGVLGTGAYLIKKDLEQ